MNENQQYPAIQSCDSSHGRVSFMNASTAAGENRLLLTEVAFQSAGANSVIKIGRLYNL